MIIGIHSRDNDLVVNPIKGKQLTNVRSSGTDEAVRLVPPIQMSLEYAVEFIDDDELVEVTPQSIRLRKRHLKEHERRRASREGRGRLSRIASRDASAESRLRAAFFIAAPRRVQSALALFDRSPSDACCGRVSLRLWLRPSAISTMRSVLC